MSTFLSANIGSGKLSWPTSTNSPSCTVVVLIDVVQDVSRYELCPTTDAETNFLSNLPAAVNICGERHLYISNSCNMHQKLFGWLALMELSTKVGYTTKLQFVKNTAKMCLIPQTIEQQYSSEFTS